MQEGKLPLKQLKTVLKLKGSDNPGIIKDGAVGSDAAVINIKEATRIVKNVYNAQDNIHLVEKSDPITFPTAEPGTYAVIVNSNDVVCTGGVPYGFLATIIVPPNYQYSDIVKIQKQISNKCKEFGISLLGGHTEISSAVNTPIVSGHMFGFVPEPYLVPNILQLENKILVIGHIGSEGIGIIVDSSKESIKDILDKEEIEQAKEIGSKISVKEIVLNLNKKFKPALFHDVTEGGLYGGLYELIKYTKYGIKLYNEPPLLNLTKKLAKWLDFNPYYLISSGALIVAARSDKVESIKKYLDSCQIPNTIIGEVTEEQGILRDIRGKKLDEPKGDEIIRALNNLKEKTK